MGLHASVSDEARDGWQQFAAAHGVSVTALIEAIGIRLADMEPPGDWSAIIEEARAIDAERRRR